MHIVILGGGFAGVYAAKRLLKKGHKVTLISKTNYFLFTPLLHEVAVGSVNRHNICTPIRDVLKGNDFTFLRACAQKIDAKAKKVHCDCCTVDYDKLLIGIGSVVNYYGIKGAQDFSIGLKGIRDAIEIRNRIISVLEGSERTEKPLSIVIVGAGPTGVEVCGDIVDLVEECIKSRYNKLKHVKHEYHLVQAAEDILPVLSKKSRDIATKTLVSHGINVLTNSKVTEVGKDYVVIGDKKIHSDLTIWSGGIKPAEILTVPKLQDEKGYFVVDENMAISGYPDIYAIGDCSKSNSPWVAQAAIQESGFIAGRILGSEKKFTYKNKGLIVSLGKQKAVGEIYFGKKTFIIRGRLAWFIKRHIYFMNILGLANKVRVGLEWILNLLFERDTSEI